jgi:hypothetical protein
MGAVAEKVRDTRDGDGDVRRGVAVAEAAVVRVKVSVERERMNIREADWDQNQPIHTNTIIITQKQRAGGHRTRGVDSVELGDGMNGCDVSDSKDRIRVWT